MNDRSQRIYRTCSCGCCVLEVAKHTWSDGDIDYSISILDNRYDHGINTLWGRLKRAAGILFGKPVSFNELYMDGEEPFRELVNEMTSLTRKGEED